MTKPSQTARWATDVGATLEPSEGEKDAGFSYGEKPPARWLNWLWNLSYRWQEYLKNLPNEAEFLGAAFDWLGAHRFASIAIDHASNEYGYVAPRTRTIVLPLEQFSGSTSILGGEWQCSMSGDNAGLFVYSASGCFGRWSFALPSNATLTSVKVDANIAPDGVAVTADVNKLRSNSADPTNPVRTFLGSAARTIAGEGVSAITTSDLCDGSKDTYQVDIHATDAGVSLYAIRVTFLDPGPRNY